MRGRESRCHTTMYYVACYCSLVELVFNLELNTPHEYLVVLESLKYVEKHIKSRTLATVSKSSRVLLSLFDLSTWFWDVSHCFHQPPCEIHVAELPQIVEICC